MSGRPSVPAAPATGHRLSQIPLKVPLESKTRSTRRLVLKGGRTHSSGVDFWCRDAPTGRTECVSCFAFELACFFGARTLKGMFLLALHFRFYFRLGVHFNWIRRRAPPAAGLRQFFAFNFSRKLLLFAARLFSCVWDVSCVRCSRPEEVRAWPKPKPKVRLWMRVRRWQRAFIPCIQRRQINSSNNTHTPTHTWALTVTITPAVAVAIAAAVAVAVTAVDKASISCICSTRTIWIRIIITIRH